MKPFKIIAKIVFIISITLLVISCEKNAVSDISGKLIETTQDFLQGDSVYLTIEIDGGEPPFAFRYFYEKKTSEDEVTKPIYNNIIDIPERKHTFALLLNNSGTITAESVAFYYEHVGPALGEATFNMIPVEYIYEESIPASKTGFMQKSTNALNYTSGNLQLKNDGSNYERRVFLEFDAADIVNKKEKSNYYLNFWIADSHSQGVNAGPGLMEVTGWLGSLNDKMTWDEQPQGIELTPLFEKNFKINAADEKLKFSGKIDALVYSALANSSSNKFCIRIKENLNGIGNKGYYFIGGNLYPDETYRPTVDVYLRKIID